MFLNRASPVAWRSIYCCINQSVRFSSLDLLGKPPMLTKKIPKLTLPPGFKVTYCHNEEDCVHICEKLSSRLNLPVLVGCDAEWVPHKDNVAVLQLCFSVKECYIFHLSHIGYMPTSLKNVIFHRWIVKVGIGIKNDLDRLSHTYCSSNKVNPSSYIDLGRYADVLGFRRYGPNPKSCWSLKDLVEQFLYSDVEKNKKLKLSNWEEFPLRENQLFYAAMDAYASLLVFKSLDNIRTQLEEPISSFPYLARKLKLG